MRRREVRPIGADRGVEGLRSSGIDGIVDHVHPLDVGPKLGLSGEIEGEMHAEAPARAIHFASRLAASSSGARGLRQCAGGVGLSCCKLGNAGGTVTFG
jgi:hypothetical protein